jgi:hypothetical protein
MDRELLRENLRLAESHVELGEHHISRQRELIAGLEKSGHDVSLARALLQTFEQSQSMHIADRERLRAELAESKRA